MAERTRPILTENREEPHFAKLDSGWGGDVGLPAEFLELFGWYEYIETASRPYPVHLVNTPSNIKANERRAQRDAIDAFKKKGKTPCPPKKKMNASFLQRKLEQSPMLSRKTGGAT